MWDLDSDRTFHFSQQWTYLVHHKMKNRNVTSDLYDTIRSVLPMIFHTLHTVCFVFHTGGNSSENHFIVQLNINIFSTVVQHLSAINSVWVCLRTGSSLCVILGLSTRWGRRVRTVALESPASWAPKSGPGPITALGPFSHNELIVSLKLMMY